MNVLITGSNGQLGTKFQEIVTDGDHTFTPFFTDSKTLDITNEEKVKKYVMDNEIDVILNFAAYTNVDKAEDEEDKTKLINGYACQYLADAIKQRNGYLIHISTDYVFDGSDPTPKTPDGVELFVPSSCYGRSKLLGEYKITNSDCHYLIIRTSWLYSNVGKNFVKTMYNFMNEGRNEFKVVYDQVGSPTNAYDLALFLYDLLESKKYIGNDGIYHFANLGVASWYDIAREVSSIPTFHGVHVTPCLSSQYPTKAVRPKYSVLDVSKTIETFKWEPRYWRDALVDVINELDRDTFDSYIFQTDNK